MEPAERLGVERGRRVAHEEPAPCEVLVTAHALVPARVVQWHGYRALHPEVLSPYLWSFSNHYTNGKFTSDSNFDPNAVSKQCGCAILVRHMASNGTIAL